MKIVTLYTKDPRIKHGKEIKGIVTLLNKTWDKYPKWVQNVMLQSANSLFPDNDGIFHYSIRHEDIRYTLKTW